MDADRVVDAAEAICRAEGIEQLSIRRLAAELRTSRATIHDLVGSTSDLNGMVRLRAAHDLDALLGGDDWSIPPGRDLAEVADALMDRVDRAPGWTVLGSAIGPDEADPVGLGSLGATVGAVPSSRELARSIRRIWVRALIRWIRSGEAVGRSMLVTTCLATLERAEAVADGLSLRPWPQPTPLTALELRGEPDDMILDACRALVRAEGSRGLTIRRIADLTHLGKSTVHERVGGHDQLVIALRHRSRTDFWDAAVARGARRMSLRALPPTLTAEIIRSDPLWLLFGTADAGDRPGRAPGDDRSADDWVATRHMVSEMVWPVALLVVLGANQEMAAEAARSGLAAVDPVMAMARRMVEVG